MADTQHSNWLILAAAGALVGGMVAVGVWLTQGPAPAPVPPVPATQPATAPVTRPTTGSRPVEPDPPRSYMDLLRLKYGDLPTTRPLDTALDLSECARILIDDPVHLCSGGHLWITRPDAPPISTVLAPFYAVGYGEQVHLVREAVLCVHWALQGGLWIPTLVCRRDDGSIELVARSFRRTLTLARDYRWDRAFSWNQYLVVPDDRGVGVLSVGRDPTEAYGELLDATDVGPQSPNEPQTLLDTRGLLAWVPWENGRPGSPGAARFVDGLWKRLGPQQGWPEKILHLVPLLDGSVLQLIAGDDNDVRLALATVDSADIDAEQVRALVAQLADPDSARRRDAHEKLQQYGPGAWPVLEKFQKTARGEARIRLQQILASKTAPTLGNMSLNDGKMRTHGRFRGGGVLFHADGGVTIANGEQDPIVTTPAWIVALPGWPVQLAPDVVGRDANPAQVKVDYDGAHREWVVTDDVHGPRRVVANTLVPLLRKSERAYSQFVGIDAQGRWVFRRPAAPVRIGDLVRQGADHTATLILDPRLPSLTPRLPGWEMVLEGGSAGWDKDDWPVIKSGGAWALHETGWEALDEKTNPMRSDPKDVPAVRQAAGTRPATTQAASRPATLESEPALLTDAAGNRYYDGREALRRIDRDGTEAAWPLPGTAAGAGPVTLVQAKDGRLFLFNHPGRAVRIRVNPAGPEPFAVEATFTRFIPASKPTRIWTDPAGRICIVSDTNRLVLLFPAGHIPREIADKMPAEALKQAHEDD